MVLTTSQQLLQSSFFASDSLDRLLGQERPSTVCERIACLQQQRKARKGVSSAGLPLLPSTTPPNALRENSHAALSAPSTSTQHGAVMFDEDKEVSLSMQAWSDVEDLFTELRRSLLETQWALNSESDQKPSFSSPPNHTVASVVRLSRPSARQRRIAARKKKVLATGDGSHNHTAKPSNLSGRRKEKHLDLENALELVTTLGFLRNKGKRELLTKDEEVILSKKMKVGQNLKAARRKLTEILGQEPSDELWAMSVKLPLRKIQDKIREADRARDQMFVSNLRLVVCIAHKYTGLGISLADLIQEGCLGLLRGLEKFDHRRGFKLSTYVHWWIRQGITRSLAEHSRTVRIPAHMLDRLNHVNKAAATLRLEGSEVSVKNISEALNMPDEMVSVALKATKKIVSLDKTKRWGNSSSPGDESMHNYIADPRLENDPWEAADKMFLRKDIDALLEVSLGKREREIVRLHYGLDSIDGRGMSLEKISHRYGISRERTRQVEGCALRKLAVSGERLDFGGSITD